MKLASSVPALALYFLSVPFVTKASSQKRKLTHWAADGKTKDDYRSWEDGYCEQYDMIARVFMPAASASGGRCGEGQASSPCSDEQIPVGGVSSASGPIRDSGIVLPKQQLSGDELDEFCQTYNGTTLSTHEYERYQTDHTCIDDDWFVTNYEDIDYDDVLPHNHTSFQTNIKSSVTAYGHEQVKRCRTIYTSLFAVGEGIKPSARLPDTNSSEGKEEIDLCLHVESTWRDHTVTCNMEVNGQQCNSCEVTPCHVVLGPEYVIDCSNLVDGADNVNTCLNEGMEDNIFKFWNLGDERYSLHVDSCRQSHSASPGYNGAMWANVFAVSVVLSVSFVLM